MGNFILLVAVVLALLWVFDSDRAFDSTDDLENEVRSGLIIFTDHDTGCEYLGRLISGVTPRLDAEGNHMGCNNE